MEPIIEESLYPFGNWHSSNVPTLPDHIDDGPMVLSTLYLVEVEFGEFTTAKTATQQNRKECTIPFLLQWLCLAIA